MKNQQIKSYRRDRKHPLPSQTILILAITATIFSIITTLIVWITKFNISENIIPIFVIVSISIITSGVVIFLAVQEKRLTKTSKQKQETPTQGEHELSAPITSLHLVSTQSLPFVAIGAILGIFLTLITPLIFNGAYRPPSDTIVTNLMNQEVQAAKTHDVGLVRSIYDANAVVIDAGCQTPGQGTVWAGLPKIADRYRSLPEFLSLAHDNVHVTWIPDDSSATRATATAETNGSALINGSKLPLRGHEQWTFAKIDGQWLITSYTYNLC